MHFHSSADPTDFRRSQTSGDETGSSCAGRAVRASSPRNLGLRAWLSARFLRCEPLGEVWSLWPPGPRRPAFRPLWVPARWPGLSRGRARRSGSCVAAAASLWVSRDWAVSGTPFRPPKRLIVGLRRGLCSACTTTSGSWATLKSIQKN